MSTSSTFERPIKARTRFGAQYPKPTTAVFTNDPVLRSDEPTVLRERSPMGWVGEQTIAEMVLNLQQPNTPDRRSQPFSENGYPVVGQSQFMSHQLDSTSPCSGPSER